MSTAKGKTSASSLLSEAEMHYLFMGWVHVNYKDFPEVDTRGVGDLCKRAFLDSMRYANDKYEADRSSLLQQRDELLEALREAQWRLRDIAELGVGMENITDTNQLFFAKDRAGVLLGKLDALIARIEGKVPA